MIFVLNTVKRNPLPGSFPVLKWKITNFYHFFSKRTLNVHPIKSINLNRLSRDQTNYSHRIIISNKSANSGHISRNHHNGYIVKLSNCFVIPLLLFLLHIQTQNTHTVEHFPYPSIEYYVFVASYYISINTNMDRSVKKGERKMPRRKTPFDGR